MAVPVDAVIVGAGLSGLVLAGHLAGSPWRDRRVLILDDGSRSVSACSWAFWTPDAGWLGPAVAHSWDHLGIRTSVTPRALSIDPYRYHVIDGARLLDVVRAGVAATPGFEFRTGHVEGVDDHRDDATVRLESGVIRARWVFDSRAALPACETPFLQFLGWQIDTEGDAFDPAVATFMDFHGHPDGRVSFAYVLPTTSRHALVEVAEYRWTGDAVDLADTLDRYLRDGLQLDAWAVRRTEVGVLPLRPTPRGRRRGRIVPIGARGGMVKASTGFALDRIHRHSAAITTSLVRHGHPHDVPTTRRRHAWLDDVFLEVLRTHPDLVEPIFARLFERNPPSAVLRFLDEDTTIFQDARLVSTLPRMPFLRAGLSRVRGRQASD